MKKNSKSFIFLVAGLAVVAVLMAVSIPSTPVENVSLSQMISEARSGSIDSIVVDGNKLTATLKNSKNAPKQVTNKEPGATLSSYGIDYNKVAVSSKGSDNSGTSWLTIIGTVLPILIIIGFFYFMMRQAQGSSNQAMSFGK